MRSRPIAFLVLAGCCALAGSAGAASPNIVLLLADDQGWSGTSVMMDDRVAGSRSDFYRTPNLERLARAGVRLSQAYAPHPNCSPTRMSLQTGRSPARLGATDIVDVVPGTPTFSSLFHDTAYVDKPLVMHLPISDLPDGEVTLAEFVKAHDARYVAAHFGKWHMNGGGPGRHGYDEHDGATTNEEGVAEAPDPKRTPSLTARALGFLDARARDGRPFYLQVSYFAVHNPTRAMPDGVARWEGRQKGRVHGNAAYAAMTEELDASVGAILDRLATLGLAGNTYVIYTSDNGGETMNRTTRNDPLSKSKTFVWEGGIRVPMLVAGPGVAAGAQVDVPVIGWDLLPTVADWLGTRVPLPAGVDGGSFAPLLAARAGTAPDVAAPAVATAGGTGAGGGAVSAAGVGAAVDRPGDALVWFYPHYRNMKGVAPQAAIRDGRHKLIVEYESGRRHLFDIEADIGERNDLAASEPELAARLAARLDAYLDAVGAKRPQRNPGYDPARDKGLTLPAPPAAGGGSGRS
jgi:arylsulfatase A-like enzyme